MAHSIQLQIQQIYLFKKSVELLLMIANACAKSNDFKIPGIKTIGIQLIDAGLQYHDSLIPTL